MKYVAINDRNARIIIVDFFDIASGLLNFLMIYIAILIIIKFVKQGFRK